MEEIAKHKLMIDIDIASTEDDVYSGKCLVANAEIVMLLNFDDENGEFDGFTIMKKSDVENYRTWEEEDFEDLKNDNSESIIAAISLDNFVDFDGSLKTLTSEFVALFTYDNQDDFLVGKLLSVNEYAAEVHLVDEDLTWSEIVFIPFSEISSIGFDTEYEREIRKTLG